jgi:hypothetical protein
MGDRGSRREDGAELARAAWGGGRGGGRGGVAKMGVAKSRAVIY